MTLTEIVTSPAYKKAMAYVYGMGAAVAIIGALFKILHLPGASIMLIAGLGVEALIFALSSFEPPHEMPDWTLVYPELIGLDPVEGGGHGHGHGAHGGGHGAAHGAAQGDKSMHHGAAQQNIVGGGSELSALLNAGAIEQKTIDELSTGVKKLAETTSQMADLSDAAVATKAYLNNVKVASDQMNQMAAAQAGVVEAQNKFTAQYDKFNNEFANQAAQSAQMTQNISAVNEAYVQHLQNVKSQVAASADLQNGYVAMVAEMQKTVDSVKEYQAQINSLSKSVSELNSIYGNMLSVVRK